MKKQANKYTAMERHHSPVIAASKITKKDFESAKDLFNKEPYPSVKMSPADQKEIKKLLPNVDMALLKDAEVKAKEGPCSCGRLLTLLDSVLFTLGKSHSRTFLEDTLNGKFGNLVICAAELPRSFKRKLPDNTIFIDDTTHIPCKDCGKAQALIVKQEHMLHWWDGKQ